MINPCLITSLPIRIAQSLVMASILLGALAHAQMPPPPPPPPPPASSADSDARVSILSKPSLEPVQAAFRASGLRAAEPVLLISYDADGWPTDVGVVRSSRNRDLDRAIIEWAKQIRIATKEAGSGRIPFTFIDDSLPEDPASIPEIKVAELAFKPSLNTVLRDFASTRLSEAFAEVHVDYDSAGKVTATRLAVPSGNGSLDNAILAWTKRIKLKPGVAGTGRLPFEFKKP
jgi:outer membrane biosynthesis protein TonB